MRLSQTRGGLSIAKFAWRCHSSYPISANGRVCQLHCVRPPLRRFNRPWGFFMQHGATVNIRINATMSTVANCPPQQSTARRHGLGAAASAGNHVHRHGSSNAGRSCPAAPHWRWLFLCGCSGSIRQPAQCPRCAAPSRKRGLRTGCARGPAGGARPGDGHLSGAADLVRGTAWQADGPSNTLRGPASGAARGETCGGAQGAPRQPGVRCQVFLRRVCNV